MKYVGKSPVRPDGRAKVTGAARYIDDLTRPGLIHGATVRSPHPHARIRSIRFHPEKAPAGSICLIAKDVPAVNGVQFIDDTMPVLADTVVRHVGEAVALVAAPTRLEARLARDAVEVDYEPLEPVLTWEEAERNEPLDEFMLRCGDVDRALAEADLVVDGVYLTGHQEHIYIEPQGMIAWYEGDDLHVQGSMQCPYYVSGSLSHAMGLPAERVKVKPAVVGGGFGGKEDYPSVIAIHAAMLARASGKPVKLVYDRHEDIVATTKRHPGLMRYRAGVTRDGRLTALDIDVVLDAGAYRSLSPVVLSRGVLHATGAYKCPHVRVRGRAVRTNTAPNAAFRGFGAPQVIFAAERHMDRIARAVGLDPLTIRLRNVVEPGDRLATGQVLKDDASARPCLERVAEKTDFLKRWQANERARKRAQNPGGRPGKARKGIGLSLYFHGAGFTGLGEHKMRSPVTVRLTAAGGMEILVAATEMGQGEATVLPQIAAETSGFALEDVVLAEPETTSVPDSGPTVASRTTMVVGGTVARAAEALRDRLLAALGDGGKLSIRDGEVVGPGGVKGRLRDLVREHVKRHGEIAVTLHHEPPAWQVFDDTTYQGVAYATYGWGADVVELEVDADTYAAVPGTATVVVEIGRAIHETLARGQIEGGTLQAIGWALLEEMKLDRGRYLNDRLATYIIPTIKDTPRLDVEMLESPWEGGPFGAKGIGELPMDGGAPAVAGALENATGIFPTEAPATPEKLLAWEGAGQVVKGMRRRLRAAGSAGEVTA
jgi:CO/xanthine dehydrogenase Mo-binding subunit